MTRPLVAVTPGDPAGIGPEVLMRALRGATSFPARLLVIGDEGCLRREVEAFDLGPLPPRIDAPDAARDRDEPVLLCQPRPALDPLPARGHIDAEAGRACHAWVETAIQLALRGAVDGIVTGPIHKEAWRLAGVPQPGHTEVLRDLAGVDRVIMVLQGARLRAALATIHVALRQVPDRLDAVGIEDTLVLLARELERGFGLVRPRIAVCGLNPHAGEGGLFGSEEADVIEPGIAAAQRRGVEALGPLPADACIPAAAQGGYDAVLAMYHDQALPAVKALAPRCAVNITLGLPFVRTSVDHGTAFDIAGAGRASPASLLEAIDVAAEMIRHRGNRTRG